MSSIDLYDTTTNAGLADLVERSHAILIRDLSNGRDRMLHEAIKARIVDALRRCPMAKIDMSNLDPS